MCSLKVKSQFRIRFHFKIEEFDGIFKTNQDPCAICTVLSYLGVVYPLYMLFFKISRVDCCELSCVHCCSCLVCIVVILCVFAVICVYCCFYSRCRTAGYKSVFGSSCDRPPRHKFFLGSLCL